MAHNSRRTYSDPCPLLETGAEQPTDMGALPPGSDMTKATLGHDQTAPPLRAAINGPPRRDSIAPRLIGERIGEGGGDRP